MDKNRNTEAYWNTRFGGGGWATAGGFCQTGQFARSQIDRFGLDNGFAGSICDFGCGGGDAFPFYRSKFPKARLLGVDFSSEAILLATKRFGDLADFRTGGVEVVPDSDIIVASNVLEHVSDDIGVAKALRRRCRVLYITVPYAEGPTLSDEHLRSYGIDSFGELDVRAIQIFPVRGWSEGGLSLAFQIYLKNIARAAFRKPLKRRAQQIMFSIGSLV